MTNYFRITAYHPTEDISVIMDSNGKFEKLWQFSAFMVSKGFKIIEVGGEDKFDEGNMPKANPNADKIILKACNIGEPKIIKAPNEKLVYVQNKCYKINVLK